MLPVPASAVIRPPTVEPRPTTNVTAEPLIITGRVQYRRAADPEYPVLARRRRQEGTVLLDVIIDPRGHPTQVTVKRSSSFPLLDQAAVEAVQGWDFDVTTSVPVRAEVPVRFELVK